MLPTSARYYYPSKYQIVPARIQVYRNYFFPRTFFGWNALTGSVLIAATSGWFTFLNHVICFTCTLWIYYSHFIYTLSCTFPSGTVSLYILCLALSHLTQYLYIYTLSCTFPSDTVSLYILCLALSHLTQYLYIYFVLHFPI